MSVSMYAPFFGLQQEAFSIAPDPRFLHLSAMHREALAHLLYGLQAGGGFVLLTGEIGTGKTTVCRCFLEQIQHQPAGRQPGGHRVAYIYNPRLTAVELLQTICQEFGVVLPSPPPTTVKPCVDALNSHLLATHAAGEHSLLVIDEAQGLSTELLEQLRLLTNLETSERKLLQIVLIGQPELRALLARPELEQLAQRVIARVHLGPLTRAETVDYVQHRLAVAGLAGEQPFDTRALALVHRLSGGVPRRINLLCQRALLGAYATGTRRVTTGIVRQAANEAFGPTVLPPRPQRVWTAAAVAALLTAGVAAAWWWPHAVPAPGVATGASVARTATATATATASGAAANPGLAASLQAFADERQAVAALARAWGQADTGDTDLCAAARRHGLACHQGQGDLGLLRRLDRPVLLSLQGGDQVLLIALGTGTALLQGAGGQEQRLPLAVLQAQWTGGFATWWRAPAASAVRNETLQRLLVLQGPDSAGAPRVSADDALRRRVYAFQVSQGLALDGLAGPLTLMQLNRASGVDEPRLRKEP